MYVRNCMITAVHAIQTDWLTTRGFYCVGL